MSRTIVRELQTNGTRHKQYNAKPLNLLSNTSKLRGISSPQFLAALPYKAKTVINFNKQKVLKLPRHIFLHLIPRGHFISPTPINKTPYYRVTPPLRRSPLLCFIGP